MEGMLATSEQKFVRKAARFPILSRDRLATVIPKPEVSFWDVCDHIVILWRLGFRTCCDKNVIVPCSKSIIIDKNASGRTSGKRLKNHME